MNGRRVTVLGGALVLTVAGCAARAMAPDAADGAVAADAADGAVAPDAADGSMAASCTPGSDQTCNDNPAVSALWGTCLPSGGCQCHEGFSYNPATHRCRPGTACMAAGSDPWEATIALDHADCTARASMPCSSTAGTADERVRAEVVRIAQETCHLAPYTFVRVELVAGCPAVLNVKSATKGSVDPQLVPCLTEALATKRWSCAGEMACVMHEYDTLP